jgi:leucyl aminopeptidase
MNIQLSKIETISGNSSIALLFDQLTELPFALTPEEITLWKQKPEKCETLLVQRLPHFLFLAAPDASKPFRRVLESFRKAGALWMETIRKEKIGSFTLGSFTDRSYTLAFLEGVLLGAYSFSKYKKEKEDFVMQEIFVSAPGITEADLNELVVLTDAVWWARDLVNEPFSGLNAAKMAEEFIHRGELAGFSTEIFHQPKIEALKMGGLLAVNQGSVDPPLFAVMEWKPENPVNDQPVVLIGKGVVYDTGGLSLKPTPKSMDHMKCDMAGAAAVAAVVAAIARNNIHVHVAALVPVTDNRPCGNALAPGDVITMMSGTTVEVLNSDAEGRLMLADALCYAKKYNPMLVIDLATLTGAASIIAGSQGILAMANNRDYLLSLSESGEEVYERIIELPLWEEFAATLRSDIADMTNLGGREGQTIIAGKFLEHFTDFPWIHLDIAGTAFLFEKEGYKTKGGTGSGIRLLFNFLKNLKIKA